MNVIKTLLLLLITSTLSYSQTPNMVWSKYFGGNRGDAKSIQKTSDGGYIIAGFAENAPPEASNYHGSHDGFVVKLNSSFGLEWANCYGTTAYEQIKDIKQTSDGGYIFVGSASVSGNSVDYWIVKINNLGNLVWEKKYGGTLEDRAFSISEAINGEYVVNGFSRSVDGNVGSGFGGADYWTIKLDNSGNIIVNKKYGGPDNDFGYATVTNSDGTYVVAGESFSQTGQITCRSSTLSCDSAFWIVKSNSLGNIVWSKCFGATVANLPNSFSTPTKMIKTSDNGYIVVGSGYTTYGKTEMWAMKLDSNGNLQWRKAYGGTDFDKANSIKQTLDGGYILAGSSYSTDTQVTVNLGSSNSYENAWAVKINSAGTLEWQKTAGSTSWDYFNDVIQINNTDYVFVGYAARNDYDCINSANRGFWMTKISTNALSTDSFSFSDFEIYPNPTNSLLNFKAIESIKEINIYEISGRKIFELKAENINQVDISSLSNGIYTVKVSNENHSTSRKIIKN